MAQSPLDPYRSRRTHRKSRNGCKNCKGRKIKCDESKPQCWQCTKHSIVCDFATGHPDPSSSLSPGTTPNTTTLLNSTLPSPGTLPGTPQGHHIDDNQWRNQQPLPSFAELEERAMSPDDPDLKLHMTDLELLHHFTINTAATLSTAPELRTWWRIDVPHLAFSHPFVMRALLALSGMHTAHTLLAPSSSPLPPPSAFAIPQPSSPSELHHLAQLQISRAHTQHALALRTANHLLPTNTSTPPAPSAATSAPLYICAVITMLTAFAAPRDPDALLFVDSTSSTIAPWLQLSRAVKRIVDQGSEQAVLMTDIGVPLRMALSSNLRGAHACFAPPAKAAGESGEAVAELAALRAWLEADGRGRCADAAESLMATFETFEVAGDAVAMRAVVGWVCTVDEAFLVAVAEREQGALAVFAFFAVLLHWVENGNWWVNGWGRHLVTTIDGLMGVEGERWLRWPREQIGIYRVGYQPVDCVVI